MAEGYLDSSFGKVYSRDGVAYVKDSVGNIESMAPDRALAALKSGMFAPASAGDVHAHEVEKARSTPGQKALTAIESAAAGAYDVATAPVTLPVRGIAAATGQADPLAMASGRAVLENTAALGGDVAEALGSGVTGEAVGEQYGQGARERAQANPLTASGAYMAGGFLGGGPLTRGLGALGESATAALGGGALARAAGSVGTMATEGAAYAETQATEDAYIQDRQLTSEQLLASMGTGAFIGGLVGLGTAGMSQVFRRAGSRGETPIETPRVSTELTPYRTSDEALTNAAEPVLGEPAAPGFGAKLRDALEAAQESPTLQKARDALETAQSAVTGADKEVLSKYGAFRWDDAARRGRGLYRDHEKILEAATEEITGQVDTLLKRSKAVTREVWEVPAKTEQVTRNLADLSAEQTATAMQRSSQALEELQGSIRDITKSVGGSNARYLRDLEDWTTIEHAVAKGDASGTYIALDRTKRAIQKKVDTMGATLYAETNPLLRDQKIAMVQGLEATQERIRQFLTDESTWGAQGVAQREANAAAERHLRVSRLFEKAFATPMGREYGGIGGRPILDADPAKLGSFVRGLGRKEGALKDKIFREYVDSTLNLADSISGGYRLEGDSAKALSELREAASGIKSTLGKADETVKIANQIDEVVKAEEGSGWGMMHGLGVGGFLTGGPLGAIGGALLGAINKPGHLIRQAAAIQQLTANFSAKLDAGLGAFFSRAAPALGAGKGIVRRASAAAEGGTRRAAVMGTVAAFKGRHDDMQSAYHARVGEVLQATANNGAQVRERARDSLGDLPSVTPRLSQQIIVAATNAAEYLKSKLPAGLVDPTVFQPSRVGHVSPEEIHSFAKIWSTVNNPLSAIEDLRRGQLTLDQVDALQAVFPAMYSQIQVQTLERIRDLDAAGHRIAYRDRLQLDILLNLNGAGEPSMSDGFAQRLQQIRESRQQQQPPTPHIPPPDPDRLKSGMQRLGENRS